MTEQIPDLDLPDPAATSETLRQALDKMPRPLFAVLDGGLFDDLPGDLSSKNIVCRSLFLDHADKDIELAGPWLVPLADDEALGHVVGLAITQPCAVFWSCPDGDMALWHHLRTINEILIPAEAAAGKVITAKLSGNFKRVLFRHWDPNVLAQTLPAFDLMQFQRLLGPASEALFLPRGEWGNRIIRASRSSSAEPSPRGALRLGHETIKAIEEKRNDALVRRRMIYLREVAPDQTLGMNNSDLYSFVREEENKIKKFGVTNQENIALWTFMQITSQSDLSKDPNIIEYMKAKSIKDTPDQRVKSIFDFRLTLLKDNF
ncbi:DUF4123 domain-containing protein [Labrys portucalensis]|uniref:DUF4123 domain-containing protein n=1 Tax=Labrys neptuniae TaxID=376174 RepID=A0ABV6ZP61_9HYPH